jgi:hypothetical protein
MNFCLNQQKHRSIRGGGSNKTKKAKTTNNSDQQSEEKKRESLQKDLGRFLPLAGVGAKHHSSASDTPGHS